MPPTLLNCSAMHQLDNSVLRQQFAEAFGPGGRVRIVRAPGRVNLIGEHTDYNDGFVFPMAIEREVRIACRMREDDTVRYSSTMFPGEVITFSLGSPIEKAPRGHWSNYVRGTAAALKGAGMPLGGMDALLTNSLPGGGGLSSSAAVEVATAQPLSPSRATTSSPCVWPCYARRPSTTTPMFPAASWTR